MTEHRTMLGRSLAFASLASVALLAGCVDDSPGPTRHVGFEVEALHSVCATTPAASRARGFDVSKWQGTIDWTKVAGAGHDFVFVRSSANAAYVDPQFAANWQGAKNAGLVRGAYHYFDVSSDGAAQADLMLATIGVLESADLPPVVDVEDEKTETAATIVARVGAFVDRIRTKTGREPILYSGGYFWDTYVKSNAFAPLPLWTAHYFTDRTMLHCPNTPNAWTRWAFWQYSEMGTVPGITGGVDLDVFDGTRDDLLAFVAASVVKPSLDGGVVDGSVDGAVRDAAADADAGAIDDAGFDGGTAHRRARGCSASGHGSPGFPVAPALFVALALLARAWRRAIG